MPPQKMNDDIIEMQLFEFLKLLLFIQNISYECNIKKIQNKQNQLKGQVNEVNDNKLTMQVQAKQRLVYSSMLAGQRGHAEQWTATPCGHQGTPNMQLSTGI